MNTHIASFQALDRSNPISDLLDMIARRGPELMRQGGGALSREQLWSGKHLAAGELKVIRDHWRRGKSLREIAEVTNRSIKTIWTHTRGISKKKAS